MDETRLVRGGALDSNRRSDLVLAALPVLAIVLLVALVVLLLWLTARDDREIARSALISDSLWVEQALRFQLSTDEDNVARLALAAAAPDVEPGQFLERSGFFVANNPEVLAIAWLAGDGTPRAALPASAGRRPAPETLDALALARASARPVYGGLRKTSDGALVIDIAAAIPGRPEAIVAGVSVSALLARQIPWWLAERYAVQVLDTAGAVLAEKTRVEPLDPALSHRISFDPPVRGAVLAIAPYRLGASRGPSLLTIAILALAVLAIVSLLALQRDMLRRRRVEWRLRDEMAFRRAMEDSLTIGMRARDLDGRITYVNPAFCRMVGFPAEELVGRAPPMPYWLPDRLDETQARHDALIHGEPRPQSYETRLRRRDGTVLDALLYEAPLIDADGTHRGWMGSIIDVSDEKRAAELALRQAETLQRTGRLITLGEMASTLAHELNQPLAAIASYAAGSLNMLRSGEARDPQSLSQVTTALDKLSLQAERAGQIIRRIQDFVRKRQPRFGPVAIAEIVEETVAFSAIDARHADVRIEVALDGELGAVHADRILIQQLLLNLIRNATEAMAGAPDRVLAIGGRREGEAVVITVADRGGGIEPQIEGRLYDAFLSTKPDGMGMGLAICRSIVELHRGRLEHAPRPGGGTVFTLTLRVAEEARAA